VRWCPEVPIRREHRWFYPIDWPQLSAVIRFRRAQGRSESCGRPHGRLVYHLGDGRWWVSGVLFLSRNLEGGCGRIGPGQELVEAALGMAGDDPADHVSQVGPWLDPNELARLNQ
jgi:hypothetical protein